MDSIVKKLSLFLSSDEGHIQLRKLVNARTHLEELERRLNSLINDSGFYLEPECLLLVTTLKDLVAVTIARFKHIRKKESSNGWVSEAGLNMVLTSLSALLPHLGKVQRWLLNQSTGKR